MKSSTTKAVTIGLAMAAFLVAPALMASAEEELEAEAIAAAHAWLALVDDAKYAESWEASAALFRGAVTQDKWAGMVAGVRSPLGAVSSRQLKSATYTSTVPGAPDGEYVILQFDTVFAHKATAVETVTPMRDPDGSWRVSGYYIK